MMIFGDIAAHAPRADYLVEDELPTPRGRFMAAADPSGILGVVVGLTAVTTLAVLTRIIRSLRG